MEEQEYTVELTVSKTFTKIIKADSAADAIEQLTEEIRPQCPSDFSISKAQAFKNMEE